MKKLKKGVIIFSLMLLVGCISVVSAACFNDSDCPSVSGEKYCRNNTELCGMVTSYRCENLTCVVSGGGLGCKNCPYGCESGQCKSNTTTTPVCTDSDGGKNYYVKGRSIEIDAIVEDYCKDSNVLLEGYCENGLVKNEDYKCPNGCKDGTCLKELQNNSQTCTDTDGGLRSNNIYVKGKVTGLIWDQDPLKRVYTEAEDYCIGENDPRWPVKNGIAEYFCAPGPDGTVNYINVNGYFCDSGQICQDGACVNMQSEKVTEKITCKFENTKKEQKCYLAGTLGESDLGIKYCIAEAGAGSCVIDSCVIDYTSYSGEKVTWKSTCGFYQYTTQDGNDETIYFDCKEGETNFSEIKNKGFKNVYFECYDGETSSSIGREACKSAEYWKKFAINFCEAHCSKKSGKCGVNSFSIGEECYLEENATGGPIQYGKCGDNVCDNGENTPSYPYYCPQDCKQECKVDSDCPPINCLVAPCPPYKCIERKCVIEEINCVKEGETANSMEGRKCCTGLTDVMLSKSTFKCVKEEILVCKDSCPLEGKCYPFGYRKTGKFCSDSGGFVAQLEGSKACENSFECTSNVCVSGKCISQGFIDKILAWFKRLFGSGEEKPKYTCPTEKIIDCMPIVDKAREKYCEGDYHNWIGKNCNVTFAF